MVSCCLEMLSFVLLILALRRYINFHIFAGGPLTFLVNSGVIETRYFFLHIIRRFMEEKAKVIAAVRDLINSLQYRASYFALL